MDDDSAGEDGTAGTLGAFSSSLVLDIIAEDRRATKNIWPQGQFLHATATCQCMEQMLSINVNGDKKINFSPE